MTLWGPPSTWARIAQEMIRYWCVIIYDIVDGKRADLPQIRTVVPYPPNEEECSDSPRIPHH